MLVLSKHPHSYFDQTVYVYGGRFLASEYLHIGYYAEISPYNHPYGVLYRNPSG